MCCILCGSCNCRRIHRHQIHLLSYGCVSLSLLATGLIFTIFSIVQKDSQVGKVWLAGPVVVVVGLVLLGKVVIDWGPAMSHRRKHSFESEVFDEMAHQGINMYTETKLPLMSPAPMDRRFSQLNGNVPTTPNSTTGKRLSTVNRTSEDGAIDCIIYSQYDTVSNSNASSIGAERSPTSPWEHHPSALRPNSLSAAKSSSPNPRNVFQNAILNTQIRPLIHMNSSLQTIQVQPQLHYIQQKPPTPTQNNHTSKHIPPTRLARPSMPSCRPSVWTPRNPVVPSASLPVINKMSEVIERPTVGAHALPECRCNLGVRDYGSTHDTRVAKRMANLYQGETFVLNDRSFYI